MLPQFNGAYIHFMSLNKLQMAVLQVCVLYQMMHVIEIKKYDSSPRS